VSVVATRGTVYETRLSLETQRILRDVVERSRDAPTM
jgi:hypothetical protein